MQVWYESEREQISAELARMYPTLQAPVFQFQSPLSDPTQYSRVFDSWLAYNDTTGDVQVARWVLYCL